MGLEKPLVINIMKDIQSQRDERFINIRKVGVKDISYPITVLDKANKVQHTLAKVNMYVNLPHQFKGIHMSRFIEVLNRFHGRINFRSFHAILKEMVERLQAEAAHMEIEFPYFLKKKRIINKPELIEYRCSMYGTLDSSDSLSLKIDVPISPPTPVQIDSGLPGSLGLWGFARTSLSFRHFIWIEDIIDMVEKVTSHDLRWPVDKRAAAERYLSVESMADSLAQKLVTHPDICKFKVTVENFARGFTTYASIQGP